MEELLVDLTLSFFHEKFWVKNFCARIVSKKTFHGDLRERKKAENSNKRLLRYQKPSMYPEVFIFVNKFEVCLFFMNFRSHKKHWVFFLRLKTKNIVWSFKLHHQFHQIKKALLNSVWPCFLRICINIIKHFKKKTFF